jgi:hypothetical protein
VSAPAEAAPARGYMLRSGKSDWRTPADAVAVVREAFGGDIDLDPCASPEAELAVQDNLIGPAAGGVDGLAVPWGERRVYVNPPFDELAAWAAKCAAEARAGSEVILLLPSRTDTAYWHEHLASASLLCFWKGRLKFVGAPAPCPFPVTFAYWGRSPALFRAAFKARGMVVSP